MFLILDVPDLPQLMSKNCEELPYTEACAISADQNDINLDSLSLLTLLNKMLTKTGLSQDEAIRGPTVANETPNHDGSAPEPPPEAFINKVEPEWYDTLKERLDKRKITRTTDQTGGGRVSRSPKPSWGQVFAKLVTGVSALFGIDDLLGHFPKLFVSKDKIANILTTIKAYLPIDRQSFSKIVQETSEFENFAKKKFNEISEDGLRLANLTSKMSEDIKEHRLDIATIQEGYAQSQLVLGDTASLLFSLITYLVQISAFQVSNVNTRVYPTK